MLRRSMIVVLALTAVGCAPRYKRPRPGPLPANITLEGPWDSTWGRMVLMQEGKHVHGTFTGYREGGVSGDLSGDVWHYIWDQRKPRQHGHGFMQVSPDGMHLEGRWGYEKDDLEGGRWAADRDNNPE